MHVLWTWLCVCSCVAMHAETVLWSRRYRRVFRCIVKLRCGLVEKPKRFACSHPALVSRATCGIWENDDENNLIYNHHWRINTVTYITNQEIRNTPRNFDKIRGFSVKFLKYVDGNVPEPPEGRDVRWFPCPPPLRNLIHYTRLWSLSTVSNSYKWVEVDTETLFAALFLTYPIRHSE